MISYAGLLLSFAPLICLVLFVIRAGVDLGLQSITRRYFSDLITIISTLLPIVTSIKQRLCTPVSTARSQRL